MPSAPNPKKHLGGLANLHGSNFEDHFGTWRVVLGLDKLRAKLDTRLALQLKDSHVDDWVEATNQERHHFQLKNKKVVRWDEVRRDFENELSAGATSACLVVSNTRQRSQLLRSKTRVARARVMVFPAALNPVRVVAAASVRRALRAICVKPGPRGTDLEMLWMVIAHTWRNTRKPGRFVRTSRVLDALIDPGVPLRFRWKPTKDWLQPLGHSRLHVSNRRRPLLP
jgi:hypothetical protein